MLGENWQLCQVLGIILCRRVQQTAPLILCDGNGAIYPVTKDCLDGIRDPLWLDMAPLCSLSMAIQSVPSAGALPKSRLAVIGLVLEVCWPFAFITYWCLLVCLQCFDAVGWAAGRASGL